jgi:MFS family permease
VSGGVGLLLYGLAQTSRQADPLTAGSAGTMITGAALLGLFVRHAARSTHPIIDVRLFRYRGFAAGAAANLVIGTALFGAALLLPLYFEIGRGRTPVQTGLLLAPQGFGAALSITAAGYLTDRVGARRVVAAGLAVALAGAAWLTQVGAHTSYASSVFSLLLIGAGMGATITPAMAAAFHDLPPSAMGDATSAINVVQRVAGAVGSALLAVVLQKAMVARLAGYRGGIDQAAAVARSSPHAAAAVGQAFAISFGVSLAVCALAFVPVLLLPRRERNDS